MARISIAVFLSLASLVAPMTAQQPQKREDERPTSKVEVIAFEANGRFLGAPNVILFESSTGENLSAKFRGGVAFGLPYGIYRIEAKLPWYYSDVAYASIYQPDVTIVMGLRFATELPRDPPVLAGRVTGLALHGKYFVKVVGVFEHISGESAIDQNGRFILAGLASARYMLMVVGEKGVVASRAVSVPYLGQTLEIRVPTEAAPP